MLNISGTVVNQYKKLTKRIGVAVSVMGLTLAVSQNAYSDPSNVPLFLVNPVVPIMMLNISKDHQLYFKAYDDYSDITDSNRLLSDGITTNPNYGGVPDGVADTSYVNGYDYYGYFDNSKCYTYNNAKTRYEPTSSVITRYCNLDGTHTKEWSGNFLNWATMARIDVVRKILYGGYRSTDTSTETVLERSFIPADAHAFAKYYDGNDIAKLTPFNPPALVAGTSATGITICNVTVDTTGYSQSITKGPLIRAAQGNYALWASNERWQCRWSSEKNQTLNATSGSNGNVFAQSGLRAYNDNPVDANKLLESGVIDYYARVLACVPPLSAAEMGSTTDEVAPECVAYPSGNYKPIGLLQEFGETKKLYFGLMTGSYAKNKSGGVLRKRVGDMADEINIATDGTFKSQPATGGIVGTLNALRIFGYDYGSGIYNNSSPGDNCAWGINTFSDGSCSNWGNPQSEIYLESLRYLYGQTAAKFATTDATNYITTLKSPAWTPAPVTDANYCAPLNVLQFNGSSSTYDQIDATSSYAGAADIGMSGASDVAAWTDKVGSQEGLNGGSWFFGVRKPLSNPADAANPLADGLCTAKTLDKLSNVSGTCTDAPRLEGSYNMAGLAYYVRSVGADVKSATKDNAKPVTVKTYGVALAPSIPKIEVKVPGSDRKVVIQPACQNKTNKGNCAIVDFKIVSQQINADLSVAAGDDASVAGIKGNKGRLYVNWEDSEQGGDYDQDMWGTIDYIVTANKVVVKTKVVAQSTGDSMGFGYVISGTSDGDGFNVQSGANSYVNSTSCTAVAGNQCTCRTDTGFGSCNSGEAIARTKIFNVGTSTAGTLKPPLFYAARWGGYTDDLSTKSATDIAAWDPTGNSYYYATQPKELKANLEKVFADISADVGSASAVATNSTRLSEGTYLYQAQFNPQAWNGTLKAYPYNPDGTLDTTPAKTLSTDNSMPKDDTGRRVYTYNGSNIVNFIWGNLTSGVGGQQDALKLSAETDYTMAQKRVDWLRGSGKDETTTGGMRSRIFKGERNILGDIVNSSPAFIGAKDFGFSDLPIGGASYDDYVEAKKSKPKLIAVGANDGMVHIFNADTLEEQFAYIPGIAIAGLANITKPDYGKASNPHRYNVDGPITVGDYYDDSSSQWRTIIVGTLGAGGTGVYALDVTDVSSPKVLFELNKSNVASMGFVIGKPSISPLQNGSWGVIFGNGDSSGSTSRLMIVDLKLPSSPYILDAGTGNGLLSLAVLNDSAGRATMVYGGDVNGNLWRFDISSASVGSWKKDYKIFSAVDKNGVAQPISAPPTLGLNAKLNNSVMVYFGTGKYYDSSDNSTGSIVHSFYAIPDLGSTITRSSLLKKSIVTNMAATPPSRSVTEANPDWTSKKGWYIDFEDTPGEKVSTKALLIADKLIFPTLIPSADPCFFGGRSWLMEAVAVGDKYINQRVLAKDLYNTFLVLGDLGVGLTTEGGKIVGSGSDATPINDDIKLPAGMYGRQSWRQMK